MTMSPNVSFFFFTDTATTEIYTLSLHDALPIWVRRADEGRVRRAGRRSGPLRAADHAARSPRRGGRALADVKDRKSTRLNSSHPSISYAVFCLKKKISHSDIRSRRLRLTPVQFC